MVNQINRGDHFDGACNIIELIISGMEQDIENIDSKNTEFFHHALEELSSYNDTHAQEIEELMQSLRLRINTLIKDLKTSTLRIQQKQQVNVLKNMAQQAYTKAKYMQ